MEKEPGIWIYRYLVFDLTVDYVDHRNGSRELFSGNTTIFFPTTNDQPLISGEASRDAMAAGITKYYGLSKGSSLCHVTGFRVLNKLQPFKGLELLLPPQFSLFDSLLKD